MRRPRGAAAAAAAVVPSRAWVAVGLRRVLLLLRWVLHTARMLAMRMLHVLWGLVRVHRRYAGLLRYTLDRVAHHNGVWRVLWHAQGRWLALGQLQRRWWESAAAGWGRRRRGRGGGRSIPLAVSSVRCRSRSRLATAIAAAMPWLLLLLLLLLSPMMLLLLRVMSGVLRVLHVRHCCLVVLLRYGVLLPAVLHHVLLLLHGVHGRTR